MMFLFLLVLAGVAAVDRWLKLLALHGQTHDLGFASFILVKNDALVFSWPAPNSVAIGLMCVAILLVAIFAWRTMQSHRTMSMIGCLLILLGALSNLFDRIAYGFVIDWAYLGHWWPVFNIADMMITVGVVVVAIKMKKTTNKIDK